MAIHLAEPPEQGLSIVQERVPSLLWRTKTGIASAEHIQTLRIAEPHPIYTAHLESFFNGTVLSAAKCTAWQYLIVGGESVRAAAELRIGEEGEPDLIFAALHESPRFDELQATITFAEEIPRVKKGDYQLRILRAPSVYLYALWLHATDDDILLPVPAVHSGLEANQEYSEEQLILTLLPFATQRATISDAEPGG